MEEPKDTTNQTAAGQKDENATKVKTPLFKKLSSKKLLIPLAVLVLLGALYYFKDLFVAAVVNGQPVSRLSIVSDLEKKYGKRALDSVITEKLIFQEARKQKVSVTQQEIARALAELEQNIGSQGQTLDQALLAEGLTMEDLIKQIRIQLTLEKLLSDKIEVTDEEVKNYIEQNKSFLPEDTGSAQLQESIRDQIKNQKLSQEFQNWITSVKDDARIFYFTDY